MFVDYNSLCFFQVFGFKLPLKKNVHEESNHPNYFGFAGANMDILCVIRFT